MTRRDTPWILIRYALYWMGLMWIAALWFFELSR